MISAVDVQSVVVAIAFCNKHSNQKFAIHGNMSATYSTVAAL